MLNRFFSILMLVLSFFCCGACCGPERNNAVAGSGNPIVMNIRQMRSLAIDRHDNLYLPDPITATLYQISPDGLVSVLRTFPVEVPFAVAVDRNGRIVVADLKNWDVFQVNGEMNATPIIENRDPDLFHGVTTLGFDSIGNLYVGENDANVIRIVSPEGSTRIMAGAYKQKGNIDGAGINARIERPRALAVGQDGSVFFVDDAMSVVRKVSAGGEVITLAGVPGETGSDDGRGTEARFNHPRGIAVGLCGTVYLTDTNNHTIRKITPDGQVSTIGGKAGEEGCVDGGMANARFSSPRAIVVDSKGNLIIADEGNKAIRMITPKGLVSTLITAKADQKRRLWQVNF